MSNENKHKSIPQAEQINLKDFLERLQPYQRYLLLMLVLLLAGCGPTTLEDVNQARATSASNTAMSIEETSPAIPGAPIDIAPYLVGQYVVPGDTVAVDLYVEWFNSLTLAEQQKMISLATTQTREHANTSLSLVVIPIKSLGSTELVLDSLGGPILAATFAGESVVYFVDTSNLRLGEFVTQYVVPSLPPEIIFPEPILLPDLPAGYPPTWDSADVPTISNDMLAGFQDLHPAMSLLNLPTGLVDIDNVLIQLPVPQLTAQQQIDLENLFTGPIIVDAGSWQSRLPDDYDPQTDFQLTDAQRRTMAQVLSSVERGRISPESAKRVHTVLSEILNPRAYEPGSAHEVARRNLTRIDLVVGAIKTLQQEQILTVEQQQVLLNDIAWTYAHILADLLEDEKIYTAFMNNMNQRVSGAPFVNVTANLLRGHFLQLDTQMSAGVGKLVDQRALGTLSQLIQQLMAKMANDPNFSDATDDTLLLI